MIDTLPVELIAKIIGELDLDDVIRMSQLSRRLKLVASDAVLNVWRLPIMRTLRLNQYETALKNLSVHMSVPRHNWVDILAMANAPYILFESTLPNLKEAEWEEAFKMRFLPSWARRKRDKTWKATFLSVLHQTWHRSCTSCTTNEAWTKYIVLNRNGSANLLEVSSRNFNPVLILNDMRMQQNLLHLQIRARLVVQLADVRILALGTLDRPLSPLTVNPNAKVFLHPLDMDNDDDTTTAPIPPHLQMYSRLKYPLPAITHINYPFYSPGGADKRWIMPEEVGLEWVGGLMVVAQIIGQGQGPDVASANAWPPLQDHDLVIGPGRQQYMSLTWEDLWTIAPWLEEKISKRIDGQGLGI
ncbi:hypothetical protein GGX14DRAFT_692450 [Mycena pura]|uniref:F-box domain-containing protein n=1 Tax=Mycena pura TaxID=153505 RepID=A0AAD6YSM3_9AGAR|nr:hypothetical protein GGX14DRAFT_692450 [Mycena pura]